jgi:hypothetical protein
MSKSPPKKGVSKPLSLYPLSLETALFAALRTGKPPKRKAVKTLKKGGNKNKNHDEKGH